MFWVTRVVAKPATQTQASYHGRIDLCFLGYIFKRHFGVFPMITLGFCVSSGSSKRFRMWGPPLRGDAVEQWNSDVCGVLVAMFVSTISCQCSNYVPFFFFSWAWFLPQVRIGDSQKVIVFQVWSRVKYSFQHDSLTIGLCACFLHGGVP